ncbi:GyrI-like domain-containing protein [Kribbella sindirgiensis]|uniref:AraC family transcriptional regulator n=1 Tax=Kribbella sindirgiensis TaxID=1124744 RepID=A0A4R0I6K2_9ACTN|nr:GyrI-like domain-containing protein [Kribbella sindirgiensis]TCC21590.1 AraC family transcriptional regulator [Kribbella sindirgiensis]
MQTEFRTVREQPTAVLRATLRRGEIRDWFDVAFPRVAGYLYRRGLVACGFPFSRDHLFPDGTYLVEAGFPVPVEIEGDGDVQPSSLPGGQVVVARHVGSYDDVADAYRAVDDWLKAEQAVRVGDAWEVYHGASGDRAGYCTEVIQPFRLVPVLSTSES